MTAAYTAGGTPHPATTGQGRAFKVLTSASNAATVNHLLSQRQTRTAFRTGRQRDNVDEGP
ncbi:hypothetical protein E2C01_045458 [Portunus trituberculatus]|uniref:Uncharacterized protein n=1 Tax=Portunus trituberculatus TaxID=210409 RepID=A0A5B7G251_PORTR|nr:hypothetical protein [Portunus trituberculatus]